jgi:hypothetical protein
MHRPLGPIGQPLTAPELDWGTDWWDHRRNSTRVRVIEPVADMRDQLVNPAPFLAATDRAELAVIAGVMGALPLFRIVTLEDKMEPLRPCFLVHNSLSRELDLFAIAAARS